VTTTYVGGLSVGVAMPGLTAGLAAGVTGINSALPDIEARLAALLAFSPAPISFAASISLCQATLTGLQASLALGLPVPDISAQIAIVLALIGELEAALGLISAQLTIITDLQAVLAEAGLHVWHYNGAASSLGTGMTTALASGVPSGGGGGATVDALILVTELSATWGAVSATMKVTP
jgi:hypothetical protein